jgi:hypothetical protein
VRGVQGVAATDVIAKTRKNAQETKRDLHQVKTRSTALAEALSPSAPPLAATEGTDEPTSQGSANRRNSQ